MKARSILKILFVCSLIVPAACGVKDPIFNTSHPGHGSVTLTTEWSGIGEGLTAPESYAVTAAPDGNASAAYSATLTGVTNKLDHLFAPGKHRLCVYNTPDHITVAGTMATVAETPGNTPGAEKFVHNNPGWLFASAVNMTIIPDAEHTQTVTMQQQVRQLTLIIEPKGDAVGHIDRIEGYLTGAASTLDLSAGTHAEPRNAELQFARITSGDNAGRWSATVRLLGIAGTEQKLVARLHFAGGNPAPFTFDSDLSPQLATFNTGKRSPLTLDGQLVPTPAETGFGATITGWIPATGGPVTAD